MRGCLLTALETPSETGTYFLIIVLSWFSIHVTGGRKQKPTQTVLGKRRGLCLRCLLEGWDMSAAAPSDCSISGSLPVSSPFPFLLQTGFFVPLLLCFAGEPDLPWLCLASSCSLCAPVSYSWVRGSDAAWSRYPALVASGMVRGRQDHA